MTEVDADVVVLGAGAAGLAAALSSSGERGYDVVIARGARSHRRARVVVRRSTASQRPRNSAESSCTGRHPGRWRCCAPPAHENVGAR